MNIIGKRTGALTLAALFTVITLTGCGSDSKAASEPSGSSVTADTTNLSYTLIDPGYTDRDLDDSWSESGSTVITLNGNSIDVDGSGAQASGTVLTISSQGVYVISGNLDAGQILVSADDSSKVQIVFNGAEVISAEGPAISILSGDKVFLTLADGTENVLTDSSGYSLAEGEDEPNAALYSKSDLTINGSGALTVSGNYMHGIDSKDDLKITGGDIAVTAVNDGIRGKDCVAIYDGNITVNAGGDGIKSNNDTDATSGWISLDGGKISVTSGEDGVQAETVLQVTGSEINVAAGGGSANAAATDGQSDFGPVDGNMPGDMDLEEMPSDMGFGEMPGDMDLGEMPSDMDLGEAPSDMNFSDRNPPQRGNEIAGTDADAADAAADDSSDISAKGLKASGALYVVGGTINVDSQDDSLHSNGTVTISAGITNLSSGDDGIHADSDLIIEGGELVIATSNEGIEGSSIYIKDGTIDITASDDGINASTGSETTSTGASVAAEPSFGGDDSYLEISGGFTVINAGGDGLDSNGSFAMTGGTVLVNGPTTAADGAIDYERTGEISGGTLVAVGASGMAMNFSESSTQPSLMINYSSAQAAGTLLALLDGDGNVIMAFTPEKSYQSVVISTPEMSVDGEYTLFSGGSLDGENVSGLWSGDYTAGTEIVTVTMTGTVVSISDTGSAVSGGMGAGGGGGNRPQGGNAPNNAQN